MIYCTAGLSLSRIPSLAAYKRAWRIFVGYAKRIRETSFTSHFEIGLHIFGVVNHTKYMQEYRSGHNEAVLKTVCPKGTGVRIPLPAPNKNGLLLVGRPIFIATVRGDELPFAKRNGEFAYRRHRVHHEEQSIRGICVARRCRLKFIPKRND